MRSSVSYILSSSTTEPLMSHPDYEQYSHDHAALLVLVRHIGAQLKPKTFSKFYDRIAKINHVKITDSTGQNRNILVRYVREHPVQNNDWGDFQTHRRLIGLISLGKYDSQVELNEICRVHESLKVKYTNTLYDSRCILLRPSTDLDSPNEGSDDVSSATTSSADTSLSEGFNSAGFKEDPLTTEPTTEQRQQHQTISHRDKVEKLVEKLRESEIVPTVTSKPSKFTTPSNFKTRALFYTENDPCVDLESTLTEYVNSLFWVLDSKRLERSREKLERVPLLLAPFEKKDFVGLDLESRNNRRRCTGRVTKNLGDLCLQAGLVTECLAHYSAAVEILRGVNDWLWLGGAWEGWCAASGLVLYPEMGRGGAGGGGGLQRNASLQEGGKERVDNNLQSRIITSPSNLVESPLTNTPLVLQPEDISRRYREAIIHYSKYQNAGIVETEASFKAARIAVAQQHPLQAASFLQNVVFINLTLSEQEKIQRFETLAGLYEEIGFQRKAAFCRRLAATRYVSPSNTTPNWSECYALMLHSFSGHKLSLDPAEMYAEAAMVVGAAAGHGGQQVGWPALQIQLLSELVVAAKRMGHSALATRHMTFLLQTMWPHLTPADQREFSIQLQSLSAQCEGAPVPLVLDSGLVIPPANLTNIPVCVGFTIKNLQPHLKPRKIQTEVADIGPFLFTPINFGSLERNNNGGKPNSKMDFLWVENDPCEVVLRLINPLPCELKVSNVRLLTGGVVFESLPETVTLPPGGGGGAAAGGDSSPTASPLTLHGTPREAGELELLGYSTHTLGVKSNCRLRHMAAVAAAATLGAPTLHPSPAHQLLPVYTVTVIPALPTAALVTSLPPLREVVFRVGGEDVVTSASTVLYQGEEGLCTVSLTNTSDIDITLVEITLTSGVTGTGDMFSWSEEEVERQLPLPPHHTMTVTVTITTTNNNNNSGGGFLANHHHHHHSNHNNSSTVNSNCHQLVGSATGGGYASLVSVTSSSSLSLATVGGGSCGGPSSLPSRLNSPVMSMSSASAGSTTMSTTVSTARRGGATAAGNIVTTARSAVTEAQLQFKYSGSLGQLADYCRTSSVYLTVEVLPSLHVTNWDVLPAEVSSQFYLVLDVVNLTPHEMEVQYTPHKHMVVSGEETCRVPIPVERCPPLTTSSSNNNQQPPTATSDVSDDSGGGGVVLVVDDDIHRSRACASHVARLVQLQWRLGEGGRKGNASLEGLTLTPAMVDVVRMSPVVWEVSVNKCRVKPTEAILCDIGNCLEVEISVRNSLEVALDELSVTVHFYQDYQNGVCNYNLETRLAMTGPNKFLIDRLEPEAVAKHTCNVFIFTPGQYKMDIQCCSNGNTANNHLLQQQQQQQQVWKFIPAIEVNVAAA